MKNLNHILRPAALIGIGLLLAVLSAAVSQPAASAPDMAGGAFSAAPTPVTTPPSEVGSTDGITLVGILIVMVVIIPIMARRKSWDNAG